MALNAIARTDETNIPANRLLIGLHGWGANAEDLAALADYLYLPGYRMIFPDAPFPHPYSPAGRMWYGFPENYDFRMPHDFEQRGDLKESQQQLMDWLTEITQEIDISLEQVVLAGFSQGGAMALDVGLQLPLAGVLVLSGYLHSPPRPHPELGPVLVVHGHQDPVVPIRRAHETKAALEAQNVNLTYQEFDMGHEISPLVLKQIQAFCQQIEA
ncbi:MAG: dienelactone hydrolase family protein [Cyanobacteria bacterium J06626_18]